MTTHLATVHWRRGDALFAEGKYSRDHTWIFEGGTRVPASAAPKYAPPPLGTPSHVDPEEAFVASLSACHMLWFLHVVMRAGYTVDEYEDAAQGTLALDDQRRMVMTHVKLRPRVTWAGDKQPTPEELRELHDEAHSRCFIANSVRSEVTVEL